MVGEEMTASYSDTENPEQAGSPGAHLECHMKIWKLATVIPGRLVPAPTPTVPTSPRNGGPLQTHLKEWQSHICIASLRPPHKTLTTTKARSLLPQDITQACQK